MSYTVSKNPDPKYFLSWGRGVQSTALAVMLAVDKVAKLDYIITADTGWEKQSTYAITPFYTQLFESAGIPVYEVSNGNLKNDRQNWHDLPLWYGKSKAPLRRQCTSKYKIYPIRQKMRELCGLRMDNKGRTKKDTVILYLGISYDEAERMADSNRAWIRNNYYLVDQKITRTDCENYLKEKDLPVPPKSACVVCPYQSKLRWKDLKDTSEKEWQEAIEFDNIIRTPPIRMIERGFNQPLYVYNKCIPLQEIDFSDIEKENKQDLCDTGYCFI